MNAAEYGRTLHGLSLNLIVRDLVRSLALLSDGFRPPPSRALPDVGQPSGELEREGIHVQLHVDRTYGRMPWADELASGARRGLGAEFRLLGFDPEAVERAARDHGTVLLPTAVRESHGWRDCVVADPDGYTFAVGMAL